ncbi:2TM domain-containing protein [Tenacibaculum sp. 190524A05c]|uniref:2TM domain-containing protein n=1 Tax=Tenacibaculum platacis TaxID=3137852 RepID=UPI0031FB0B01
MFTENYKEETQYLLAKKRVEDLKKFYKHLTVYVAINLVISILKISRNLSNGETLEEAIYDFNTYAVWLFWGIAIVIQAFKLFGLNSILGRDWEEKQIEKHINKK